MRAVSKWRLVRATGRRRALAKAERSRSERLRGKGGGVVTGAAARIDEDGALEGSKRLRRPVRARRRPTACGDHGRRRDEAHPLAPRRSAIRRRRRPRRSLRERSAHGRRRASLLPRLRRLVHARPGRGGGAGRGCSLGLPRGPLRDPRRRDGRAPGDLPRRRARLRRDDGRARGQGRPRGRLALQGRRRRARASLERPPRKRLHSRSAPPRRRRASTPTYCSRPHRSTSRTCGGCDPHATSGRSPT